MAPKKTQRYPRDPNDFLDPTTAKKITKKFSQAELDAVVRKCIVKANAKSGTQALVLPRNASTEQIKVAERKAAAELFKKFQKYCVDPARADADFAGKHVDAIATTLDQNQLGSRSRMNAGWRYQFLALELASKLPERFAQVSGGGKHSDISATLLLKNGDEVRLYISVKNRSDTISGSKWPAAIESLEQEAIRDINRTEGSYLCVFGAAMEKGQRKRMSPSVNTEFWKSDFFWEFLTGLSYEETMEAVARILELDKGQSAEGLIPAGVLTEFQALCIQKGLVGANGTFLPKKLLKFFL
jgi:hypothetical protein